MFSKGATSNDFSVNPNIHCPKCGLALGPGLPICPNDGTRVVTDVSTGELFEGKYEILERIAAGGMGVVFKAKQHGLKRIVAVKMLQTAHASDSSFRRFQQEAQALAKLDHPNLVRVYELGITAQSQPYMIMEFVDGVGLDHYIRRQGKLSLQKSLEILLQVCEGLEYVHDFAIWHRDLKPSNIMLVDPDGDNPRVKLVDFGIAKMVDNASVKSLTQTGEVFGSPLYMSPEQAKGIPVDQRSDIYSLGCVLYEMLSGQPPFDGHTPVELILKQVNETAKPINNVIRGQKVPNSVAALVEKMLEKEPAERFQNVHELKAALDKILAEHRTWYHIAVPSLQKSGNSLDLVPICIGAGVVALLAVAGTFLVSMFNEPHQNKASKMELMDVQSVGQLMGGFDKDSDSTNSDGTKDSDSAKAPPRRDKYEPSGSDAWNLINGRKSQVALERVHLPNDAFAWFKERKQRWLVELTAHGHAVVTDDSMQYIRDFPLGVLDLGQTSITRKSIPTLCQIVTLENLNIEGCKLTTEDCAELATLHHLRNLHIGRSDIDDAGVSKLCTIRTLNEIYLDNNPKITNTAVASLKRVPLLRLHLNATGVDDGAASSFAEMNDLSLLSAQDTKLGDETLDALAKLPHLRFLNLDRTEITDAGLRRMNVPNLIRLSIVGCTNLTPSGLHAFKNANKQCSVESSMR